MKTTAILSTLLAVALAAPAPSINHSLNKRQGQNFQAFTGALGGIAATPITDSSNPDRKFQVKGDTFVNIGAALQRSCDQQFNSCANLANGGDKTLNVSACSDQKTQCDAAGQGNTGAANDQAAAPAANAGTGAAKVPCNQASNATAGSASPTAAAAAAATSTAAAKVPCNTASGNAGASNANAGNGNKNKGDMKKNKNKGDKKNKNNGNGNQDANADANAANPCNKKRDAGSKGSSAARITRRYKVE